MVSVRPHGGTIPLQLLDRVMREGLVGLKKPELPASLRREATESQWKSGLPPYFSVKKQHPTTLPEQFQMKPAKTQNGIRHESLAQFLACPGFNGEITLHTKNQGFLNVNEKS